MVKIAITACPYSATRYTKQVLCNLALDIGHEQLCANGIVSWRHAHLSREEFSALLGGDVVVLHQVRHPVMVISKLMKIHTGSMHPVDKRHIWHEINEQTEAMGGQIKKTNRLHWSMSVWYWWNKIGIEKADGFYRIENLPYRWKWFLEMVGQPDQPMPIMSKKDNRHTGTIIRSWDDMSSLDPDLTDKIISLTKAIGYNLIPYEYLDDPYYDFPESINGRSIQATETNTRLHYQGISDAAV